MSGPPTSALAAVRSRPDALMEAFFFYLFASLAVATALAVVFPPMRGARAPIHSAIALVACFFCVAATYAMLQAHLLAVLQVLVYAGAIMVLFIFVIMLLNLQTDETARTEVGFVKVLSGLLVLATTAGVMGFLRNDDVLLPISKQLVAQVAHPETYGSIEEIGKLMFSEYLFAFELTSILLLAAIVGAVVIAKRDPRSTFMPEALKQQLYRERHGKSASGRKGGA